ncbi:hypothetical protein ACVMIL_009853 [Bradyrhizobium barranii subsp. barranii]
MADGAILAGLHLVLEDHLQYGAIVLETIGRADQTDHLIALDHAGARISRERSDRGQIEDIDRQDLAVGIERHAGADPMIAGVDVGDEGLDPVGDVFDGTAEQNREADHRHVLVIDMQLHPERAADVGRDHANAGLGDAVVARIEILELVGRLRRVMHGECAGGGIVVRNDGARLQRHRGVAAEGELFFHHVRGMRKGVVNGAIVELGPETGVIDTAGIDQRATNLSCTVDIDDDGEVLVIDLDQLQRIFRNRPALGDDGHHSLPGPDHAVERQWQLRSRRHALEVIERAGPGRADLCEILAGGNEMHAFERARLLGIDGDDLRVRMRTAQERSVEHARQAEVADIASAAGEQPLGVRARHGAADIGIRAVERGQRRAHVAPPLSLRALATASMASTIAS